MSFVYMQMMAAEMERDLMIRRAERRAGLCLPERNLSGTIMAALVWLARLAGWRHGAEQVTPAAPSAPLRCARARRSATEGVARGGVRRGHARFRGCGARDLYSRIRRATSRL